MCCPRNASYLASRIHTVWCIVGAAKMPFISVADRPIVPSNTIQSRCGSIRFNVALFVGRAPIVGCSVSSSHRRVPSSHRTGSSSHRTGSSSHRTGSSSHRVVPSSHRVVPSSLVARGANAELGSKSTVSPARVMSRCADLLLLHQGLEHLAGPPVIVGGSKQGFGTHDDTR